MDKMEILTHYLSAIDSLLLESDEMNDAEIDVRTTISQIRGMTDMAASLLGMRLDYEQSGDNK